MAKRLARKDSRVATDSKPTGENHDSTVHVPQREKIAFQLSIRERQDLTERQKVILEAALDKDTRCIMIDGIWGDRQELYGYSSRPQTAQCWSRQVDPLRSFSCGGVRPL